MEGIMLKIEKVDAPDLVESKFLNKGLDFYQLRQGNPYPYMEAGAFIAVDSQFHKTDLGDGDVQECICNGYTYLFEYNGEFMIKPLRVFNTNTDEYVVSFSEDIEDSISIDKNDIMVWGRVVGYFVEC